MNSIITLPEFTKDRLIALAAGSQGKVSFEAHLAKHRSARLVRRLAGTSVQRERSHWLTEDEEDTASRQT